jgi:hypothetical protein
MLPGISLETPQANKHSADTPSTIHDRQYCNFHHNLRHRTIAPNEKINSLGAQTACNIQFFNIASTVPIRMSIAKISRNTQNSGVLSDPIPATQKPKIHKKIRRLNCTEL